MASLAIAFRLPLLLFRRTSPRTRRPSRADSHHDDREPYEDSNLMPSRLYAYDEMPKWYQDNPYILTHYRPVTNSYNACLYSLSYLHNESVNIYSHLLPAITLALTLPLLQLNISKIYAHAPWMDRLMLTLTPMTALGTLSLSSTYHTLMNHSPFISASCLMMDYAGILSLILASFTSGIYVGFYDSPFHQRLYWGMIAALTLISALLTLHPRLQGPLYRPHRTAAFILTALSGFVPLLHGLYIYGPRVAFEEKGSKWWLAEGFWYGVGAAVFASRFPEKWVEARSGGGRGERRGRFDLWGSSHQVFHICVVFGAASHCWGVWVAWRNAV